MAITLLSALPHSLDEVEAARSNPAKDYVRGILQGYKIEAGQIWSEFRNDLEVQAGHLFAICRQHGVKVVREASRDKLAEAAASSAVVILLAHWKTWHVATLPPDLLGSPSALAHSVSECVRQGILPSGDATSHIETMGVRAAHTRVVGLLETAIESWQDWLTFGDLIGGEVEDILVSSAFGLSHARAVIDGIFGAENLIPGSCLELGDGLYTPAQIADCFPQGWDGICDFFSCKSEYLAEETKGKHPAANFRADSRSLDPQEVIPALAGMIPEIAQMCRGNPSNEDFAHEYMELAYRYDRKFSSKPTLT